MLWELLVLLLDDMGQDDVLVWFVRTLTGSKGNWMLCHCGAGNVNYDQLFDGVVLAVIEVGVQTCRQ